MSFSLTTPQIVARTKTVTRRIGWGFLKPGDLIQAVEKGMGLSKGEKVKRLAVLRVISVQRERLFQMGVLHTDTECAKEGFPHFSPADFVRMFADHNGCDVRDMVTRIEFEYPEIEELQ